VSYAVELFNGDKMNTRSVFDYHQAWLEHQAKISAKIVTPVIYNQEEYHNYGVHCETGEIYSRRMGSWHEMSFSVSGKSPYPSGAFSVNGKKKFIVQHIAVHETLNPVLPVPPSITDDDWDQTPKSVKRMLRHVWQVNHIDHCHTNYRPDNLEWTTAQQNVDAYQAYKARVCSDSAMQNI
jgi:hypothetical protein